MIDRLSPWPVPLGVPDCSNTSCAAVSSGRGVWCETMSSRRTPGRAGEYFYAARRLPLGSPHSPSKAVPLEATLARGRSGSDRVTGRLRGRQGPTRRSRAGPLRLYDTAKIVNILFRRKATVLPHRAPGLAACRWHVALPLPPGWSKYVVLEEAVSPNRTGARGRASVRLRNRGARRGGARGRDQKADRRRRSRPASTKRSSSGWRWCVTRLVDVVAVRSRRRRRLSGRKSPARAQVAPSFK